jgi:hypothetical protein
VQQHDVEVAAGRQLAPAVAADRDDRNPLLGADPGLEPGVGCIGEPFAKLRRVES